MTEHLPELEIESLAYNGYGVGRWEGKVVFIPLTAPGDRVRFRILQEQKNLCFGEIAEMVAPSSQRRSPPCPVFGQCGGCHWQHLPYPIQVAWKESIFKDQLRRHGGVAENAFSAAVAAPAEWGYRSRVQFKCRLTEKGFVAGFFRRQSHFVIDIVGCPLADPVINATLDRCRRRISGLALADRIPQIDISSDEEGRVRVVVHQLSQEANRLAQTLRPEWEGEGVSVYLQSGRNHTLRRLGGEDRLALFPLPSRRALRLGYEAGCFSQVNAAANRNLVAELVSLAGLTGKERVVDLFCGVGNLTFPLARSAGEVIGIENYPAAVESAHRNAAANGIGNVRFFQGDANREGNLLDTLGKIDLAVLDPPREGAFRAIKSLLRLQVPRILYVSCNPSTLARDLVPLLHAGYEVTLARAYDFFPQTFHIEGLVHLQRRSKSPGSEPKG
ncbi:MAG: class I SAM-dependent RNA methyltransferase [Deltaproteobacteria bacterium]|nr:class I SAM-dependent RNA methyltransferase [Deltaproteobacteria bacterium]